MDQKDWFGSKTWIAVMSLVFLIVLFVSLHSFLLTKHPDPETGVVYTYYNNYLIFSHAFDHLVQNEDLYRHFPQEYYDLYKYSPTFAILMAPFSILPDGLGLFLWNLLNAAVLLIALWKIPVFSQRQKLYSLALVLIEMITSLQNAQSNALIAGLIILAYIFMEEKKPWLASLFIVLTVFIKLFGLVALVIFIFYPGRIKTALISLFWGVALLVLPLIIVTPAELIAQYQNWIGVLNADLSVYQGYSVMGWLYTWFGLTLSKDLVVLVGAALLLIPLLQIKKWSLVNFRLLFLSSVLIWMVIFNHMAESPTFVIAVSGVALWYFSRSKHTWLDVALLALVVLFTILSPTDLFPVSLRENLVKPYALKAVPCILVWVRVQVDIWTY